MVTKSTKFHNEIAQKYEKEYQTPYWNLYHEVSWKHIKKYLPKDKKYPILDAGGGTGYWSRKLAELGFNVVCSDVAEREDQSSARPWQQYVRVCNPIF